MEDNPRSTSDRNCFEELDQVHELNHDEDSDNNKLQRNNKKPEKFKKYTWYLLMFCLFMFFKLFSFVKNQSIIRYKVQNLHDWKFKIVHTYFRINAFIVFWILDSGWLMHWLVWICQLFLWIMGCLYWSNSCNLLLDQITAISATNFHLLLISRLCSEDDHDFLSQFFHSFGLFFLIFIEKSSTLTLLPGQKPFDKTPSNLCDY